MRRAIRVHWGIDDVARFASLAGADNVEVTGDQVTMQRDALAYDADDRTHLLILEVRSAVHAAFREGRWGTS